MHKSKIAVFTSSEAPITLEGIEIPELNPGEILVRNEYTTLCRSDLYTYSGKRKEKTPTILGHEIVGRIAAFGPASPKQDERGAFLRIDDRVTWGIYASDPDSEMARAGIPQKGPDLFKYGHEQITKTSTLHGGLGEYTILRANTPVAKLDESVPLKVAAIINCAVATVAGAMRVAGKVRDKNVLISGAGMLGMIACAMSKTRGARQVIALDVNAGRLEAAKAYGADAGIEVGEDAEEKLTAIFGKSNPFQVLIELSGVAAAMEQTMEYLSVGGKAVWVGATYPQRNLQINAEKIVRKLLTITGLHNYNQEDFIAAVQFIEEHHATFPFAEMIYDKFQLEEVNQAFEYALSANPFRVGVRLNVK